MILPVGGFLTLACVIAAMQYILNKPKKDVKRLRRWPSNGIDLANLFSIALGAILVNNFIFSQFLGICPFMGVSKKIDTAAGMGMAVTFVMGLASAICWPINAAAAPL